MDSGIVLNELVRSYGATSVISNLNMHVEKGSIYGLLGPSGCGKTTLLKIILGRLVPDSGDVKILGKSPHTPGHFVPGSRVGYAPQELALYFDITIYETMLFHARMHGMSWPQFLDRKKWLYDFLELPDEHRLVRHLSGGQQRRLSLAVALLHNPELLVLDEPTVGVDPLLRLKIWDHLREIAGTGVTVIITTHYIEEARQADKVGLMRDGRLLAEGNPDTLMQEYNHDTLEGVFLDLCRGVKRENLRITSPGAVTSIKELGNTNSEYSENVGLLTNREKPTTALSWKRHLYHIVAISRRKFFQLSRTPLTLFFELLLPTVQIFLFMTCIGPSPKDLPFAVVNLDQGGSFRGQPINLGNDLVNYLGAGNELQLYNYTSLDSALGDVRAGIAWAVLYVPSNFSQDIFLRYLQPTPSNQSNLYFYVDLSNYQVDLILQQKVSDAFMSTANQLLNTTVEPVVTVPVYGKVNGKFSNFLAPGLITLIAFAHSIGMTAIAFVREKVECTIDRIFAAGVKPAAIIIGHFITNSVLLVVQVGVMLIVAIFAFEIPVQGSVFAVFTIVLALGVVGMSLGLFLSTVVNNETEGVMLALSTFFPSLLLSGILWPPQAIPVWLRWLSLIMPTTNAAEACRSVMIRGWGVSHVIVWRSYLISFAWMLGFLIFASLKLRTTDAQWFWQRNKSIERSKKRLDKI